MNWYNIKNLSESSAEVVIYDEIGAFGIDSKTFIDELAQIPKDKEILLRVNSPGGSVIDGLAIYDAIRRTSQKVTTRIEGLAASIASIIALAGDEVIMSENSLFMIHNVWGGETGDSKDMRKAADLMDKMSGKLVSIYMAKSGKEESEVKSWMDSETWFNAEEALEAGFITAIEEPIALAAKFDIYKCNYKNKDKVVQMFNENSNNLKMKEQIEELKNFISEMFDKKTEVKNVKILDSSEVNDKISSLENAISASEKTNEDLSETLKEKESNIVALADEITNLEAEVAKYKGTSSEVAPEKDPNPVVEDDSTPVNAWDSLAGSIINNKSIYLK